MSIARRLYRFLTHADKYEQIAALKARLAEQDARLAQLKAEIEAEIIALEKLRERYS